MKPEMKRKRERKTDYKARVNMLKSRKARIVFRKTGKYVIGQYVKSKEAKDFVVIGVNSKNLLNYGWPEKFSGSLKSLPACYLAGLLLGKKIQEEEKTAEAILDIGLLRNVQKSRIHAFLKGIVDAGIKIKHKKEFFPEENRIAGRHLKNRVEFEKIKEKILKE